MEELNHPAPCSLTEFYLFMISALLTSAFGGRATARAIEVPRSRQARPGVQSSRSMDVAKTSRSA